MENKIRYYDQSIFIHPFTCTIAGPSGSGKTHLLFKILDNPKKFIKNPPQKIIYCYSEYQLKFNDYRENINFHKGLYDLEEIDSTIRNLVIYDDLMDECHNDKQVKNLFTKGSHHKNISVFILSQNIFNKGEYSRTINLNCNYTILFNNPRDRSQIKYLAREMYPDNSKFLISAFMDASKEKHGYLFIDNKQETDEKLRVQTKIFNHYRIIYLEKKIETI